MRPYRPRSKTGRVRLLDLEGEPHTVLNEEGKVYGELVVVRFLRAEPCGKTAKKAMYLCICSCGKNCEVAGTALRAAHNNTFSCGHIRQEMRSRCGEDALAFKHGHATQETLKTYYQTHYKKILADQKTAAALAETVRRKRGERTRFQFHPGNPLRSSAAEAG